MKTYKQKLKAADSINNELRDRLNRVSKEYGTIIKASLGNTTVSATDISLLRYLVEGLEDIRKNGGAYSSAKAVELLYALGELK